MTVALLLALVLAAGPEVETSPTRSTRLYVRTLPPGAAVQVDGRGLGRSDGLFLVPPGVHRVTVELGGFSDQVRQVELLDGRITRLEIAWEQPGSQTTGTTPSPGVPTVDPFAVEEPTPIYWVADDRVYLGYVHDTTEQSRSLQDGCAIRFQRPVESNQLVAVELFAGNFQEMLGTETRLQVVVLDEHLRELRHTTIATPAIGHGRLQWSTLPLEATEVPERFLVALMAAPGEASKIALGIDPAVSASHSYTGLPEKGLTAMQDKSDWMLRAVLTPPPRNAEIR